MKKDGRMDGGSEEVGRRKKEGEGGRRKGEGGRRERSGEKCYN
jgi:hypothetical protein